MDKRRAGFTLLEVLIAIAIVAMIVGLIWGSVAGTAESKDYIETGNEVYHEGHWALDKMEADLTTAFLDPRTNSNTRFLALNHDGVDNMPMDELHFTSFNHVKYNPSAQESDQCEVSYFIAENPDTGDQTLYRREAIKLDIDPNNTTGEVYELAAGVVAFNLRYYDGTEWLEEWDSLKYSEDQTQQQDQQQLGQPQVQQSDEMVDALPVAAEITLILNGPRDTQIAFHTKVRILLSSIDLSTQDAGDTSPTPTGGGISPTPRPGGSAGAGIVR